jgi:tryptophanyl-tRNA synthetase
MSETPKAPQRILSGVQSSGRLHLGNYYGAIREFVRMQHEGEALFFIANLHALNTVRDPVQARALTFETACAFLALGLDPARATLFRQSDVPEVTELFWVLGTEVPVPDLENAHSYKDKLQKGLEAKFGLFAYPVLMAADILLYDSDVVPVGRDQRQHLELARDWAGKFNRRVGSAVFKLPQARTRDETAVVPGRDGEKMSKSYGNTIDLFAPDKDIEKQVKSVKTDSTAPDAPKPVEKQPLYELLKVVLPPDEFALVDAAWREGGDPKTHGYGFFKNRLLEGYHATFDQARACYAALTADPAEVERVLKAGGERARAWAAPVMARVRAGVGL